jgi:hypothetical protein
MTMHSSILRVAGLATACLALVAVPALAHDDQAGNSFNFVGTFSDSQPFSDVVVSDYACFDGQTGTASGVDSIEGRYNNAPPFFHFTGVGSGNYRIDYPDGRYILGDYRTKIEIEANAESGSTREKDTEVSQDHAAVYLAGQQIGTVTVRETLHTTFDDANHNGAVDPGELKSSVDNFRVSCP